MRESGRDEVAVMGTIVNCRLGQLPRTVRISDSPRGNTKAEPLFLAGGLCQNILDYLAGNTGEPDIEPLKFDRETGMLDTQRA